MIGSILTCVGLGIVLRPILNIEPVEIMPLVIGIAFVIDYVFSFDYGNRWGLYFGVLMCIYAFKNAIPMDKHSKSNISCCAYWSGNKCYF